MKYKRVIIADAIAFYNVETSAVNIITMADYQSDNYDRIVSISKAAELAGFGRIHFANSRQFMLAHPDTGLDRYIAAEHSEEVYRNFDFYIAAYVHLSQYYHSFETLVENDLCKLIDTFIDACVSRNTDHVGTLCYFKYDIHKILKLRKAVFNMFKKQLNDFSFHETIYLLQHVNKLTDKQFRKYRDNLKNAQNQQAAEQAAAEAERTPAAKSDDAEAVAAQIA